MTLKKNAKQKIKYNTHNFFGKEGIIMQSSCLIIQVTIIRRRPVVSNSDWHLDNLRGSHHQGQVRSCCQSNVLHPVHENWFVSLAVMLLAVRLKWRKFILITTVVETSVTTTSNSPSQDYTHVGNQTTWLHITPWFKPFTGRNMYFILPQPIPHSCSWRKLFCLPFKTKQPGCSTLTEKKVFITIKIIKI